MEKRNMLAVVLACALCAGAAAGCSSDDGGGDAADGGSAQGAAAQGASDGNEEDGGSGSASAASSSSEPDLTFEFDVAGVGFYGVEYDDQDGSVDSVSGVHWFWWDEAGDVQVYLSSSYAGSASAADVLRANADQIEHATYSDVDRWSLADDAELSAEATGTTAIGGVEWAEAACSFGGTSFEGDALEGTACYALSTVVDPDDYDSFATDIWILVIDNTGDQSVPQEELAEAARAVAATMHVIEG